jgi:hypothetical protein
MQAQGGYQGDRLMLVRSDSGLSARPALGEPAAPPPSPSRPLRESERPPPRPRPPVVDLGF